MVGGAAVIGAAACVGRYERAAHRPRRAQAGGGSLARQVLHRCEYVHAKKLLGLRGAYGPVGVRAAHE